MKKKTLMIFSVVAILLLGCSKSGVEKLPDDDDRPILDDRSDEKMTFSGSQLSSKAEFSNRNDGSLDWSAYDNLGVYSVNAANDALVHSGTAMIKQFTGSEAAFESNDSRFDWAGSGAAQTLNFYAYYPQMLNVPTYSNGIVKLSVSDFQDGEFGKYHICYSTQATTMSATDVKAGKDIKFMFTPATSILRVRVFLDNNSDIDNISIREFVVNISDNKSLAGDFNLNLKDGSTTILSGGKSQIRVTFTQPVAISKNSTNVPYINLAILPETTNNVAISFLVIATDGKTYALDTKLSPAKFEPGVRYNLDRSVLYKVDPATTPDGIYIIGGDGWESVPINNDGGYTSGGDSW